MPYIGYQLLLVKQICRFKKTGLGYLLSSHLAGL